MALRFALLTAAALVIGTSFSPASAQSAWYGEEPGVQAPSAPPPDQIETPPAPPGVTWIWKPGHWRLKDNRWVWEPGKYVERPAPTAVWVPGHWVYRPWGYVFVPGHWL